MGGFEIHLRWMIDRDIDEVVAIERRSFEFPWTEQEIRQFRQQRNGFGFVVEHDERVVGFVLYEVHPHRLHVVNLAVQPEFRRRGVGATMVRYLVDKLSAQRRNRIVLEVRERNLDAQLFFRAMGFHAVKVLRDFYDNSPEDAYVFQYRYQAPEPQPQGIIEESRC